MLYFKNCFTNDLEIQESSNNEITLILRIIF